LHIGRLYWLRQNSAQSIRCLKQHFFIDQETLGAVRQQVAAVIDLLDFIFNADARCEPGEE